MTTISPHFEPLRLNSARLALRIVGKSPDCELSGTPHQCHVHTPLHNPSRKQPTIAMTGLLNCFAARHTDWSLT